MGALQPMHLMLAAAVVLLVFGPRKLPELARSVGESIKEPQKSVRGGNEPEPVVSITPGAPAFGPSGAQTTDAGSAPPHLPS